MALTLNTTPSLRLSSLQSNRVRVHSARLPVSVSFSSKFTLQCFSSLWNNKNQFTLICNSFRIEDSALLSSFHAWIFQFSSYTSLASMSIFEILSIVHCSREEAIGYCSGNWHKWRCFMRFLFLLVAYLLVLTSGMLWIVLHRFLETWETIKFDALLFLLFFMFCCVYTYFSFALIS